MGIPNVRGEYDKEECPNCRAEPVNMGEIKEDNKGNQYVICPVCNEKAYPTKKVKMPEPNTTETWEKFINRNKQKLMRIDKNG